MNEADHAPASPPEERSHLVLDGRVRAVRVVVDCAGLRVASDDRIETMVPLRRVDRATCRGQVIWSSEALVALADHGIPVGFVRGDGRLAAVLSGRVVRGHGGLAEGLAAAARYTDLAERFEDWRRAQVSFIARGLDVADPSSAARVGLPAAEAAFATTSGILPRARAERISRHAQAFAELLARRVLHDAGCPLRWLDGGRATGLNLGTILGEIALWRLVRGIARPAAREMARAALEADAASLFAGGNDTAPAGRLDRTAELASPRLRRDLSGDLKRLVRFLQEIDRDRRFAKGRRPLPR